MLTDTQRARAAYLFDVANGVQHKPERAVWANHIKDALSYVLHGEDHYEVALDEIKREDK